MSATETLQGLCAFEMRGGGTDAERRAGLWLAEQIEATGREATIETFWCRPNWAFAQVWHAAAGLAGSLVAVHTPLSALSDVVFGVSIGRRLTPERASQNIVATPPQGTPRRRVSLILTAPYDAGRAGLVDRDAIRRPVARMRTATGGLAPGWAFWFAIVLLWLLGVAIARFEGASGALIGVLQLIPTVALVLITAALLEKATADFGPSAGDDASGVAAALAIAAALDASPLYEASVDVVLTGAGDGTGLGLRRYLRTRRRSLRAHNTVVVGIGPCAHGTPRYWLSDGPFLPVRHFKALRRLGAQAGQADPQLDLTAHRGRGSSPALPARLAGMPSIAIGSLDALGLSANSHQQSDTPDTVEEVVLADMVEIGLLLAEAIDVYLAELPQQRAPQPPPPRRRRRAARRLF
jgi:hypothetical protein